MLPEAPDRKLYEQFVTDHKLEIFFQPWYLDAVCGLQNWSCVLAHDRDGSLASVWPFYRRKRAFGLLKTLDKPPYCLFLGPWVAPPKTEMNPARELSRQSRLLEQLEAQLPAAGLRRAYLPYHQTIPLSLAQKGWQTRQFQSYRLPCHAQTEEQIWQRLDPKVRYDLKAYDQLAQRIEGLENHQLPDNFELDYRSSKAERFSRPLAVLFTATQAQKQSVGWLFRNDSGQPVAAVWLPFDTKAAYLLIAVSDPKLRSQEKAVTQLIWHAIRWACSQKLVFDFEGSSLPGVEAFYRSWGPEPTPYLGLVWKKWRWLPG